MTDWSRLRAAAEAAAEQLRSGPREWPGRPSAQRLALFLEASPATILALLDELDQAHATPDPSEGTP